MSTKFKELYEQVRTQLEANAEKEFILQTLHSLGMKIRSKTDFHNFIVLCQDYSPQEQNDYAQRFFLMQAEVAFTKGNFKVAFDQVLPLVAIRESALKMCVENLLAHAHDFTESDLSPFNKWLGNQESGSYVDLFHATAKAVRLLKSEKMSSTMLFNADRYRQSAQKSLREALVVLVRCERSFILFIKTIENIKSATVDETCRQFISEQVLSQSLQAQLPRSFLAADEASPSSSPQQDAVDESEQETVGRSLMFTDPNIVDQAKASVNALREKALGGDKDALTQLIKITDKKKSEAPHSALPEAFLALAEIYGSEHAVFDRKAKKADPFHYKIKSIVPSNLAKARRAFLDMIDHQRAGIYFDLAQMYYHGEIFEKNPTQARALLLHALDDKQLSPQGRLLLAKSLFLGRGGVEDFQQAFGLLKDLLQDKQLDKEGYFYLGELYYLFGENKKFNDEDCADEQKRAQIFYRKAARGANAFSKAATALLPSRAAPAPEPVQEEYSEQDDNALAEEYRARDNGEQSLLSKLCYEFNRRGYDDSYCQHLRRAFVKLKPTHTNATEENFYELLEAYEHDGGTYYDSAISSDSDSGRERDYLENAKALSANKSDAYRLAAPLKTVTKKCIAVIAKAPEDEIDEARFKHDVEKIKIQFSSVLKYTLGVNARPEPQAREDHEMLMHYVGNGDLSTALCMISTPFRVPQLRGLHFFTKHWSRPSHKKFHSDIFLENHPLLEQPIYSAAVHDMANVKPGEELDEVKALRLERCARRLTFYMQRLHDLPKLTNMPQHIQVKCQGNFANAALQIQHLYTNDYALFTDEFLPWAFEQKLLPSMKIPYVSTADIQSKHAVGYAIGNKYYTFNKRYRLRPNYDADLRAHHPHVGAVYLTLHELEDFFPSRNRHIPSLNASGEVSVIENIIRERESTFDVKIPAGRAKHIELIRFPSFHHQEYKSVMLLRYGLTKSLYESFREALLTTRPHSPRRRLVVTLLGEHICAYKTSALYKRAQDLMEQAKHKTEQRHYLLFRTRESNFSMDPDQDCSAVPNGDDPANRARRLHTKLARIKRQRPQPDSLEEQVTPGDDDMVLPSSAQRQRSSGP